VVSAITQWRPKIRRVGKELKQIRGFSLHSVNVYIAFFVSTRSDALMLGTFFGPVAIGIYRFAIRITDMITDVSAGGLGQISLPHLARFSDPREFARQLGRVLHAGVILAVPLFGILFACADHAVAFIGPQWTVAAPALRALCVAGVASSIATILAPAIQAAGRPGVSAAIGWVKAGVTAISLAAVGIINSHATAQTQVLMMAITFTVIHVSFALISVVIVFRWILRLPLWPAVQPGVPALISGVVAAVAGWAAQPLTHGYPSFVALVITGCASAVGAGIVLICFDREIRSILLRIQQRLRPRRATA
jgi:O-antigen/teichoic acid export membrane protein